MQNREIYMNILPKYIFGIECQQHPYSPKKKFDSVGSKRVQAQH